MPSIWYESWRHYATKENVFSTFCAAKILFLDHAIAVNIILLVTFYNAPLFCFISFAIIIEKYLYGVEFRVIWLSIISTWRIKWSSRIFRISCSAQFLHFSLYLRIVAFFLKIPVRWIPWQIFNRFLLEPNCIPGKD